MARLEKMAHAAMTMAPMLPGMLTGGAGKRPAFNLVISNVPGPKEALYLNGARLDEAYPMSIPADYLALNITVSGNGDNLGFGFTACRRSVPGLQRMPDYIEAAFCRAGSGAGRAREEDRPHGAQARRAQRGCPKLTRHRVRALRWGGAPHGHGSRRDCQLVPACGARRPSGTPRPTE